MEILNFEADVLETQAELGKMLMIFVISISKLTKTARSDEEVREAYSDRLLVNPAIQYSFSSRHALKNGKWYKKQAGHRRHKIKKCWTKIVTSPQGAALQKPSRTESSVKRI